jgi:hypothetical protein
MINWQKEIAAAKTRKADYNENYRISEALDFYRGFQAGHISSEYLNEYKVINHLFSQIESVVPALLPTLPKVHVSVDNYLIGGQAWEVEELERIATIREAATNFLLKQTKTKDKVSIAIIDAMFSFGVIKTNYLFDIVEENGKRIKTQGNYIVERIDPADIYFDQYAGADPASWKFIMQKVRLPRFQLSKSLFLADILGESPDIGDNELVKYWEVYDLFNNEMLIINETLEVKYKNTIPQAVSPHPFTFLFFNQDPKSPYPIAIASQALDLCSEFNELRSRLNMHNKRYNRIVQYVPSQDEDEDMIADNISKLQSGGDGTIIITGFNTKIQPVQFPSFSSSSYDEIALIKQDIQEIIGIHREFKSGATATEASIAGGILQAKQGKKVNIIIEALAEIAKKLDKLVSFYLNKEFAVKTSGKHGDYFLTVSRSSYINELSLSFVVDITTLEPQVPQVEQRNLLGLLQILGQAPQLLAAESVVTKIAKLFNINDKRLIVEVREISRKFSGVVSAETAQKIASQVTGFLVKNQVIRQEDAENAFNAIAQLVESIRPEEKAQPGFNLDGTPIGGKDELLTILGDVMSNSKPIQPVKPQ